MGLPFKVKGGAGKNVNDYDQTKVVKFDPKQGDPSTNGERDDTVPMKSGEIPWPKSQPLESGKAMKGLSKG